MGFLDSLKEIGIGNTGPYGRMSSGATNLNAYVQQRQGLEAERGVTQALALAAKNGNEISMKDFIDISEKWGVPLSALIQRGQGINNAIFAQNAKAKLKSAMQTYMNDKKQPGFVPDEKYIMKLFQKTGITDPRIMGMFKDAIVKMQDQKRYQAVGINQRLFEVDTLGNINKTPVVDSVAPPPSPKTVQLPDEVVDGIRYKVQRKPDGTIVREVYGKKPSNAKPTDFETAYQQHIKIPGNEKVTRAEFRTKEWQKESGELGDSTAFKLIQDHVILNGLDPSLETKLYGLYNKLRKDGVPRAEAVQKTMQAKHVTKEIAQMYIDENNGDVNKAREAAIADGYTIAE